MLEVWPIVAGVLTAIGASLLGAFVLGIGAVADAARESAEDDFESDAFEDAMDESLNSPGGRFQILAISLVAAALSGAVTARLASEAPVSNAAIVGAVGSLINLIPVKNIPRWMSLLAFALTLPITILAAWLTG